MIERDYSHCSPQELNRELRALYSQFPPDVFADLDISKPNPMKAFELVMKHTEVSEARRKSEHKAQLLKRFWQILGYAQISDTFRQSIFFSVIPQYEGGVIIDDEKYREGSREVFKVGWLVDKDNPKSGGIFDPKRAKEIERVGFKKAIREQMRIELDQSLESILSSGNIPERYEKWREEFIIKHGEQP